VGHCVACWIGVTLGQMWTPTCLPFRGAFGRFAGACAATWLAVASFACAEPTSLWVDDPTSGSTIAVPEETNPAVTATNANDTGNTDTGPLTKPIGYVAMSGCASDDYYAQFSVGETSLNLALDTGSTSTAVASAACKTCQVGAKYQPSASAKNTGKTTSTGYLDGSGWAGPVYRDAVAAGSMGAPVTPNVNLSFAAIASQTAFFGQVTCASADDTDFDGIIGLGPDTQLEQGTTSFLTLLSATGTLAYDAFALQTCDIGGKLWFGGYDPAATSARPSYTPMTEDGGYAVTVAGMTIGGQKAKVDAADFGPMAVDNGTAAILLPSPVYSAFETLVESNQAFLDNFGSHFLSADSGGCAAAAKGLTRAELDAVLPKLSLTFDDGQGGTFEVETSATNSYLVAGVASGDASGTVLYCPSVEKNPVGILGNPLMRSHVVIFDRANKRIGFAPQKGCSQRSVLYPSGT
jgi:hypothetical protein